MSGSSIIGVDKLFGQLYYLIVMKSTRAGFAPILIIIAVVAFAAVGGYFYLNSKKPQVTPEAAQTKNAGGSAISSIQDALSKSQSLKCEYTDENGNKSTTFIKSGNIRVSTKTKDSKDGEVLTRTQGDEVKSYFWDPATKKGTVFTISKKDTQAMQKQVQQNPQVQAGNKEDLIESIEKYKQHCKTESVSDSLFTPPTDVQFTDLQAEMKKAGINMEDIKNQMKNLPQQPQGGNPSQ